MSFETMLQDLCMAYGPSGREDGVAAVIASYLQADSVQKDALGNLIAYKKGKSGKKLMLCAHMDQNGLVVTDVEDTGFLRINRVGGIAAVDCIHREIRFENGLRGVVGYETENKTKLTADFRDLFVDIGAKSRQEALEKVGIGDMAVFAANFNRLGEHLSAGAMDDRCGCAVVIEAFNGAETEHDLYAVFSVQEELGCRGAGAAAYAIEPALCLVCDVTGIGDTPKSLRSDLALGKGPAVKAMDGSVVVPQRVRRFIKDCAIKAGIPTQDEVIRQGGTDTGVVQRSRAGVTAGAISIPCRYIHSVVETVAISDLQGAVALLKEALKREELPLL